MKKINSTQTNVKFLFCADPVTIDKRASWGADSENLQHGLNGAFLKLKSETEVSHLVQPNEDKTAPIGWILGDGPGLFHKSPIHIEEEILEPGTTKKILTRDGEINYQVEVPSVVCYNDKDGQPDLSDSWVQKLTDVEKNYVM